jgi:hypothetical protein
MECNFNTKYKDGFWMCEKCGYIIRESLKNAVRECVPIEQPQFGPNLVRRIANFTFAVGKHLYKGMPTCSQEELDKRLGICKECPLFKNNGLTGGICTHESCGCNVQDEVVFLNKLAWSDQVCPIGQWSKIERKE